MPDIYIYDTEGSSRRKIKLACESYLIIRGDESEVLYCGSDLAEAEVLFGNVSCCSLFFIEAGEELCRLSDRIRDKSHISYIVITVKDPLDIVKYLSPSVRPSGFIFKPPENDKVIQLLNEIDADRNSVNRNDKKQCFSFRTKSRDYSVEFDNIIFFESREKKICVRTSTQEYLYYGTFAEISEAVNSDFIRIHKSFMINKKHIKMIDRSDNSITMDDDSTVFYSRTYKNNIPELFFKQINRRLI